MVKNKEHASKLTQSQSLMWIGQKLNPSSPLYNVAYSFDIGGSLDIENFKKSFQELKSKVSVFRTVFFEEDGVPYQYIRPHYDYDIEIIEFEGNNDEIQNWLKNRTQVLLDLSKPLFDTVLLKISNQRYIWYLNFHHIITDATSSTIIHNLMSKIYGQINQSNFKTHKTPPSQRDNNPETLKTYWEEKVSTFATKPTFYGKNKTSVTTLAKRISLRLGVDTSKKLKQVAKEPKVRALTEDLSLFNIFAAVLFIYIHRVSGQNKIAVGTPVHNRVKPEFKEMAGLFIEIFPLSAELSEEDTFRTVLERIKLESNTYIRHAQPGTANAEISRSFNVIFNYINASFSDFNGLSMNSDWIHPNHSDPAHQMRCHVYDMEDSGDIEVSFDLNSDIFHDSLFHKVPTHFSILLHALIDNIDQPILKPSLVEGALPVPEGTINVFNSIIQQFEEQVDRNPAQIALRFEKVHYSYDQLNRKANQLANYLSDSGIRSGERVALYLERSPEYILSVLAVMKIGAAFIPISRDQPKQRVAYILKDSNSTLILTSKRLKANIPVNSITSLVLDEIFQDLENQKVEFLSKSVKKKSISYIIYTSGSTGKPKGVLLSQNAISNYLAWAKKEYATNDKFIFPLFTSIGFDLTITSTFLPLITGGELIIYGEASHGTDVSLIEVLTQNKVNCIKLTPSHLALIKGEDMRHSKIRTMIVGGEDFKTHLAKSIKESFDPELQIFNEYGPTEVTVGCMVSRFDMNIHTEVSVPIGLPISENQAFILDSYHNRVPEGVIGELYMTGVGLAEGYINLPESTSEKFIDHPFAPKRKMYRTGDLARINENGYYEYFGRVDEQIKLRGFRIELTDIEANLLKHPAIENSAVVLIENKKSIPENEIVNCSECGLPSNYPNTDFDENGVCQVCITFKDYKDQAQKYFKTEDELRNILLSQRGKNPNYDCISLLSGGKDSSYILARLTDMGLRVLAFTLDNGYISEQAKGNIKRIVSKLGVDHIYGTTEHMNKIFVDSLHRHQNVCNGCFKTIYTLSTQIALEKQIPFVVTGLSRGQFFETRLTEELFWDINTDTTSIDETILEARKLYHQEKDAVKELMEVSMFDYDDTFNKVQFVDFYRYSDVSLGKMLKFLKEKVDWVRRSQKRERIQ